MTRKNYIVYLMTSKNISENFFFKIVKVYLHLIQIRQNFFHFDEKWNSKFQFTIYDGT